METFPHTAQEKIPFGLPACAAAGSLAPRPFFPRRKKNCEAVALVIVLFAVALVSIVVLAYFNLAMLNRNISFSSAGQARANILALSALNFIKGDCIAEIQSGSTQLPDSTGSSVPIYSPTTNNTTTMLPYRMTAFIPVDYTIPPNLIKWSSGTYPLWPATSPYNSQAGPIRASTNSTATPSLNGHFIANSLWTKPNFGTSATFPTSVVPQWVYMTRQGPLPNTSPPTPLATLANSAAANTNYVVGRYAYTVYDEGGLLDVQAAGYSPTTFNQDPTDVGRKGSQGFADLTQLDPTHILLSPAQVDQFVNWRNAATGASTNSYVTYLTTNDPTTTNGPSVGFLKAAPGDQATVSRQDLIQYWSSELGASTNIIPYLTTFSREKNAPSWGPEHDANDPTSPNWTGTNVTIDPVNTPVPTPLNSISYTYYDNRNQASITVNGSSQLIDNRFFPDVRVTSSFVQPRLSGEQAVVGEPLVKNRFDLNKLAWITYQGVAPGVNPTDVYRYFGLTLNPDGSGSWIYNHTSVTPLGGAVTQAKQIMTLDQVAAAGREPDFFELLQAAILQGSMGLASGDPTHANDNTASGSGGEYYRLWEAISGVGLGTIFAYEAPLVRGDTDSSPTHLSLVYGQEKYQIIQIGANIIDQYHTDNFPTDIMLNSEHIYGIQNLPYINGIASTVLRPSPGLVTSLPSGAIPDGTFSDPSQQYIHQWVTFSLWNPHQNAAFPPAVGPAKIRIAITSGEVYPVIQNLLCYPTSGDYMGRKFEVAGTPITSNASPNNKDGPAWIGMNLSDYPTHFSEPIAINPQTAFTSDGDNPITSNMNDIVGIVSSSCGSPPWQRAGIYVGWSKSPDNPYKVPKCATLPGYSIYQTPAYHGTGILYDAAGLSMTGPFIIELQYEDPTNPGPAHWHTYQVYRGVVPMSGSGAGDAYMEPNDPAWSSWSAAPPATAPYNNAAGKTVTQLVGVNAGPMATNQEYNVNIFNDPRAGRLNMQVVHAPTTAVSQLAENIGASTQVLPGADAGNPPNGHFPKAGLSKNSRDMPNTWINNLGTDPSYYFDRDFNRRVGDAAGWAGASPLTAGALTQRPIHLNRPFRSVAELGYVFRDDAWKNLNLFSANSADSGLLDLFYIGARNGTAQDLPPPDFVAGKMNINSAAMNSLSLSAGNTTSLPLQALLSAGLRDYLPANPTTINNSIAVTDAATLASSIVSYIKAHGPLLNIADLPSVFPQDASVTTANPGLKGQREALVRALADSADTRTWNLMIDIVAQAGKFNPTATNMNNFTVEGEKHYWLHVAIDRFTGEIVDQQLEPVWE